MEARERSLNSWRVGPAWVHRMEDDSGRVDPVGPHLVQGDLSAFRPRVLLGAPVTLRGHLE